MSIRAVPTAMRQVQQMWTISNVRHFQTSALRLAGNVVKVKDAGDFQKQVLDSKKPVVVDFHATWCGPCRVLEPRLEKVLNNYNKKVQDAAEKQVTLAKVDIDELGDISEKYNVQAVPTVLAFKNGREISRFTGAADEGRIEKMFEQLGR